MATKPTYLGRNARYDIDRCEPQNLAIQKGQVEWTALSKGHYPGRQVADDVLPGLSSIGFWNAAEAQDWGENPHRNEGIEIIFLETGTMSIAVDGKKYDMRAGQLTITRPWQLHKLGVPNIGPGKLHWLILDVGVRRPHQSWHWPKWVGMIREDLMELTQKLRRNENPLWNSTPALSQTFREVGRTVAKWDRPHSISRLSAHLNELLVAVLDMLSEQQTYENVQLTSHRRTIECFLRDFEQGRLPISEAWTLESMAKHCGMGMTAFSKYCREIINVTPIDFLNSCRLDQAAEMLRKEPGLTITEVAFACGFNSSQYFATRFRKRFKAAPREFV